MDKGFYSQEKGQLIAVLACLEDGVIFTDEYGIISLINDSARLLTEWDEKQIIGKHIEEVLSGIKVGEEQDIFAEVKGVLKSAAKGVLKRHSVIITKNGKRIDVLLNCCSIKDLEENAKGYVVIFHEISSKEKVEKVDEEELEKAKDSAETANKARSEFVASMRHQIRTPINGIVGMIDLTMLTDLTRGQRDNLVLAKSCANSLLNIIDDILDFSKQEVGRLKIDSGERLKDTLESITVKACSIANAPATEYDCINHTVLNHILKENSDCADASSNGIPFDENGNVYFVEGSNVISKDKIHLVEAISSYMEEIMDTLVEKNLDKTEIKAQKIKDISNEIEAFGLKSTAFKIQLAARRGNLKEAVEATIQIRNEFEAFKKSIIYC